MDDEDAARRWPDIPIADDLVVADEGEPAYCLQSFERSRLEFQIIEHTDAGIFRREHGCRALALARPLSRLPRDVADVDLEVVVVAGLARDKGRPKDMQAPVPQDRDQMVALNFLFDRRPR